jgi:hypothetical protein
MTLKPINLPKAKRYSQILGTLIILAGITAFFYYTGLLERIGS